MIDREARDKLRQALARIRTDQTYTRKHLIESSPKTDDKTPKQIHLELCESLEGNLPTRANEDPHRNAVREYSPRIKRAELFLASDLEYVDLDDEGWNLSGILLLGGLGLMVLSVVILAILGKDHDSWLRTILIGLAILGGVSAFGVIYVGLIIIRTFQCIHIFRVRVLRQDRSCPDDPDDFWPFVSKEQYEQTLQLLNDELTVST